jgi:ribosomal protein S18 acetylase RimI-like enzyme
VGEVGGEPVTTGLGFTFGGSVSIFDIATLPAHRRRGYGAAVTVQAIRDGLSSGASWAWLQSSAAGLSVYERLGFRTVESWPCWIRTV